MTKSVKEILILTLFLAYSSIESYAAVEHKSWNQCHENVPSCTCSWVSGKKTADCRNSSFTELPQDLSLSAEVQSIVLDNTPLRTIRNFTFQAVGMWNLQKISMRNCQIQDIAKSAFSGLSILYWIDLSDNNIRELDPLLFVPTESLRQMYLNRNKISKLEDGVFANLKSLATVELENNEISYIGFKAFDNVRSLRNIKLNDNQLSYLNKSVFENFSGSLRSLELNNNPWKCDCNLRDFMIWYRVDLYTNSATCQEPENLKNISWKSIDLNQFVCKSEAGPLLDPVTENNNTTEVTTQ